MSQKIFWHSHGAKKAFVWCVLFFFFSSSVHVERKKRILRQNTWRSRCCSLMLFSRFKCVKDMSAFPRSRDSTSLVALQLVLLLFEMVKFQWPAPFSSTYIFAYHQRRTERFHKTQWSIMLWIQYNTHVFLTRVHFPIPFNFEPFFRATDHLIFHGLQSLISCNRNLKAYFCAFQVLPSCLQRYPSQ